MDSCERCVAREDATMGGRAGGIGRRTFLAQSAILAAAAALAACGGGDSATAPTTLSGPVTLRVSDYPALANVGGIALATIDGGLFAITRTGASSFVTLSRVCPHQGSIVNVSGSGFLCPNHGAQFSSSGTWVGGERTSSMRSYPTAYDPTAGTLTVG
jgi:cytochrome b6-f complex iron-sulfur subunit